MTRINVVPVEELTTKHLVAEYRENPRVFALAHKAYMNKTKWYNKQPMSYSLGTGHVLFFYNRLKYISTRQKQLVAEMIKRGYNPQFTECLEQQWRDKFPANYWNNYVPTEQALQINRERIKERLEKQYDYS